MRTGIFVVADIRADGGYGLMPATIHKLCPGVFGNTRADGDTLIVEAELQKCATGRDVSAWIDTLPVRCRFLKVRNALLWSLLRRRGFVREGEDWGRL